MEELLERHGTVGRQAAASRAEGLPARPALHTVVVTCMDARIDVYRLFGLAPGEVHVLRNAGGVVTDDVVRSLAISQRKLDTRDVLIVQHAGCGLSTFTDDEFAAELVERTGSRPDWRCHTFADPAESVREGMALLRRNPFLVPGMRVRGFVLDLAGFGLAEVDGDGSATAVA
ncbi:carbonic anhydrase [Pseudonocardia sp.]|uniref:beta-class carbonic anhydrase n=1 Tax=Pseudonocardia sp. TaxID=60912 RepID=UPI00342C0D0A